MMGAPQIARVRGDDQHIRHQRETAGGGFSIMTSGRKYRRASELHRLYRTDLDRHLFVFTFPGSRVESGRSDQPESGSRLREWFQSGLTRCKAVAQAAYFL